MNKVIFIINDGVYPYHTGGMEVFNYHLIKSLSAEMPICYIASQEYDFDSAKYVRVASLKPTKIFTPLWMFLYLMFHPEFKRVVLSFSAAHWLVWRIYELAIRTLRLKATIVIHYGKTVPPDHFSIYSKFFRSAENIVAVSEDIKNNYDAAYGINCKVVYPLIPFTKADKDSSYYRVKYHVPIDSNVIAMVGSLKGMKNPQRIIEALCLFDKEELVKYKPHVVYAGAGPMMEELKFLVESKGLSEYVSFLGLIPNPQIREIMAMADAYLIASDFEGTSVSLLEAMYNSKAVVASNVPGLRDMISNGENGLLYEVDSPEQLKECIIELLKSKPDADRLGRAARYSYDLRYDYKDVLNAYKDLLR